MLDFYFHLLIYLPAQFVQIGKAKATIAITYFHQEKMK